MNNRMKPLIIVAVFWIAAFIFVIGAYSGEFGFQGISGYAVNTNGSPTQLGSQSIAIVILFFTNLVTLFFLLREMAK